METLHFTTVQKRSKPPATGFSHLYRTHFPYGFKKRKDGKWFAFNREYHILGHVVNKLSIYSPDIPDEVCFHLEENLWVRAMIKTRQMEEMLWGNPHNVNEQIFFLYNDATNPIRTKENMRDYLEKLSNLMALKTW
jgi:hypothetical protein